MIFIQQTLKFKHFEVRKGYLIRLLYTANGLLKFAKALGEAKRLGDHKFNEIDSTSSRWRIYIALWSEPFIKNAGKFLQSCL